MIKKVIISIINMIVATLLFLVICTDLFSNTILNVKYIKKTLEKNNYYELTYSTIKEDLAGYAPQLHIGDDETILDDIVDKKQVKQEVNNLIDSIYYNKRITVDISNVEKKLDDKITNSLNKYNIVPNTEEQKSLQKFKDTITGAYKNQILYSEKYIKKLPKNYQRINNLVPSIIKLLIFFIVIFIIVMILIQKNSKEFIKNIGLIFLTTGILSAIIKYLCIDRISHILILNENISRVFI